MTAIFICSYNFEVICYTAIITTEQDMHDYTSQVSEEKNMYSIEQVRR